MTNNGKRGPGRKGAGAGTREGGPAGRSGGTFASAVNVAQGW